jgi:DNA end-binding protein Ku
MPRTLWKGAITFGLVHTPVDLYPAEQRREFKFSMLVKRDFSPVGAQARAAAIAAESRLNR